MSPLFNLDVSEIEDQKPIPEGVYPAEVFSIEGPKSGPKSTYLTWVFQLIDEENNGRRIWHNTPIDGKGAFVFVNTLSAVLGKKLTKDELDEMELDTDDWIGEEVTLQIRHYEYTPDGGEPEMRHEIAKIHPAA